MIPFQFLSFLCRSLLPSYGSLFLAILFCFYVNGINSLISLTELLLLSVQECKRFLCINLYPANSSNLLISYSSFLVASLGFSMCTIMLSANSGSFTSFSICIPLIIFLLNFHEEMATHSSILARRIPGTEEPSGLLSMGSHRVGHDWSDLAAAAAAGLPNLCWLTVVKVDIFVLFLILEKILSPLKMVLAVGLLYLTFMILT